MVNISKFEADSIKYDEQYGYLILLGNSNTELILTSFIGKYRIVYSQIIKLLRDFWSIHL